MNKFPGFTEANITFEMNWIDSLKKQSVVKAYRVIKLYNNEDGSIITKTYRPVDYYGHIRKGKEKVKQRLNINQVKEILNNKRRKHEL